jgi:transcriptional regulator with XRE-family HTH domain
MPYKTEKIREFRHKLGMTQAELGRVLQVPQSTVARWETGFSVPSAEHIGLMCDFGFVHGISPEFFFTNYSELKPKPERKERENHDQKNR